MTTPAPSPERVLEVLRAQHTAIDLLFAQLIMLDNTFFPSKSAAWPAIVDGCALIRDLEKHLGQP